MKRTVDWPESLTRERLYELGNQLHADMHMLSVPERSAAILNLGKLAPTQAEVDALKPRTEEAWVWIGESGMPCMAKHPPVPNGALHVEVPVLPKQESVRVEVYRGDNGKYVAYAMGETKNAPDVYKWPLVGEGEITIKEPK
jgi:hypothetical protein